MQGFDIGFRIFPWKQEEVGEVRGLGWSGSHMGTSSSHMRTFSLGDSNLGTSGSHSLGADSLLGTLKQSMFKYLIFSLFMHLPRKFYSLSVKSSFF